METIKEPVEEKPKLKCEWLAISPRGYKHCVHDNHIDFRIRDGCNSDLCPIAKSFNANNKQK